MDDDVCEKNVPVNMEDCHCASPLESINLYSTASCVCQECIEFGKVPNWPKSVDPSRGPEVNLSSYFSE